MNPDKTIHILKTKRLVLRDLRAGDKEQIFQLRSNHAVNRYLHRPKAKSLDDAVVFIENIVQSMQNDDCIYWVILNRDSGEFLGTICFWNIDRRNRQAEIGFELHPEHQGMGYMSEAIKRTLDFGRVEMNIISVCGVVHPENIRSIRILEKFGFKLVAGDDGNSESESTYIKQL